jgi:hypothetical protein
MRIGRSLGGHGMTKTTATRKPGLRELAMTLLLLIITAMAHAAAPPQVTLAKSYLITYQ